MAGRVATLDTFNFHKKLLKARGMNPEEYFTDHERNAERLSDAGRVLEAIWGMHKPSELWVNHTSFDMPRVAGALYKGNANALPWNYQTEMDLATAKFLFRKKLNALTSKMQSDPLRFPKPEVDDRHDSISDCLYNLSALSVCFNFKDF
jgi:hypothetical protein